MAHKLIWETGRCNFEDARIEIASNFNFKFLNEQLKNSPHELVSEFLRFGFPLDHNGKTGSDQIPRKHTGVRYFETHMDELLKRRSDIAQ